MKSSVFYKAKTCILIRPLHKALLFAFFIFEFLDESSNTFCWYFPDLDFDPEDRGTTLLRKSVYLLHFKPSHLRIVVLITFNIYVIVTIENGGKRERCRNTDKLVKYTVSGQTETNPVE
jgi:hypothetical protein